MRFKNSRFFRLHFLIIVGITIISIGKSNDFILKHITTEQLLPGASVFCVFQDNKGLMWFGIESLGLCKYDGKKFTVYSKSDSNSISSNYPICIAEDKQGVLWIGTTEGLNAFDRNTGRFINYYQYSNNSINTIPNNYINDILVDQYNNLWIATQKGLCILNSKRNRFTNLLVGSDKYTTENPAVINKIFEDSHKNIWIGSYSSGLFLVDAKSNKAHTLSETFKLEVTKQWFPSEIKGVVSNNFAVMQICEYDENTLLIGKLDGLFLFNHQKEEFVRFVATPNPMLNASSYNALIKDSKGIIWAGSTSNGLLVINKDNSQNWLNASNYSPNGLSSNTIRYLFEDKSGLIWIATKFEGIHTYDKRQEIFSGNKYNSIVNNEVKNSFVLSLLADKHNGIWIGTKTNGLLYFNPKTETIKSVVSTKLNNSIADRIECLCADPQNNIWIGTDKGMMKFDTQKQTTTYLKDYFIRGIVSDEYGNIWIGTNSAGVLYFNSISKTCERFKNTKHTDFFNSAAIATRGIKLIDSLLWISTLQDGLYKYNVAKDLLTHYLYNPKDSQSISGDMVRAVFKQTDGTIWVTTKSKGLNIYHPQTGFFSQIYLASNSNLNTVYNILEDNKGQLWMGTHNGLVCYNTKKRNYISFDQSYGLYNTIYEANARCKTTDGLLVFGGNNGLNIFNPLLVHKTEQQAPLIITSIKIYDLIIDEDISSYKEYTISFKDKYFSLEFAQLNYMDPLKVKYKYKLEGFDKEWVSCGNRNFASYTALPPGEYYFNVTIDNIETNQISKLLRIKITITSPIWRKPIFIIGTLIFIFLSGIIIYFLNIRFIQKNEKRLKELVKIKTTDLTKVNAELEIHKRDLEKLVQERTADLFEAKKRAEESDKLKSAFLANMSHEIRTPLNVIIGLSNILVSRDYEESEIDSLNGMLEANSKALLQLINDIIDISKIEANQVRITKAPFYINSSLQNIIASYKNQIDAYKDYRNVELILDIPSNELYIVSDKIRLEQVIKNLINNSLKFTNSGSITIGYHLVCDQLVIRFYVKDTGIGIPPTELKTVFDRFKRSESKENIMYGGTGLGLSISLNLARLLGGTLEVESELNKGSTFFFEVPLELYAFQSLEKIQVSKSESVSFNWQEHTVLIAEDENANFKILKSILKRTAINIVHVKDGISAVKAITDQSDHKIDLILMDIKLPLLNGIEAMVKIKNYDKTIPIIAQTAYAMNHEETEILNSGFDGYISKPIIPDLLLDKMSEFIGY